jgi:hypothetical protein
MEEKEKKEKKRLTNTKLGHQKKNDMIMLLMT